MWYIFFYNGLGAFLNEPFYSYELLMRLLNLNDKKCALKLTKCYPGLKCGINIFFLCNL